MRANYGRSLVLTSSVSSVILAGDVRRRADAQRSDGDDASP
jgi:hypothetical protein